MPLGPTKCGRDCASCAPGDDRPSCGRGDARASYGRDGARSVPGYAARADRRHPSCGCGRARNAGGCARSVGCRARTRHCGVRPNFPGGGARSGSGRGRPSCGRSGARTVPECEGRPAPVVCRRRAPARRHWPARSRAPSQSQGSSKFSESCRSASKHRPSRPADTLPQPECCAIAIFNRRRSSVRAETHPPERTHLCHANSLLREYTTITQRQHPALAGALQPTVAGA